MLQEEINQVIDLIEDRVKNIEKRLLILEQINNEKKEIHTWTELPDDLDED